MNVFVISTSDCMSMMSIAATLICVAVALVVGFNFFYVIVTRKEISKFKKEIKEQVNCYRREYEIKTKEVMIETKNFMATSFYFQGFILKNIQAEFDVIEIILSDKELAQRYERMIRNKIDYIATNLLDCVNKGTCKEIGISLIQLCEIKKGIIYHETHLKSFESYKIYESKIDKLLIISIKIIDSFLESNKKQLLSNEDIEILKQFIVG